MLEYKAKKIVEEMNELKTCMTKMLAENLDPDYLDEEELRAMEVVSKCYKLLNSSMEDMVEQAEVMDQINAKLDTVLIYLKS